MWHYCPIIVQPILFQSGQTVIVNFIVTAFKPIIVIPLIKMLLT
jgi:hypothetical protein